MIKIVINDCFGGYGLSAEALLMLMKMKSKGLTTQSIKDYYGAKTTNPGWKEHWLEEMKKCPKIEGYFYRYGQLMDDNYNSNPCVYSFTGDRDHPDLVKVVEELGSKKASGEHAQLKVVAIPDGVKWEIEEYDGSESVHEKHRSWS